jgi:hypothetical protein
MELTLVFVHGWSVTNLDTYGELPQRLQNEASKYDFEIKVANIFLGQYITFNDDVRLEDVSRAFNTAVAAQLGGLIAGGGRFICITHSTGGPAIRDWLSRYYKNVSCPMSHLVMLAPANYGSALAQLGKSRLSRIKAWFDRVEPGQLILDWLELGSSEAWKLNEDWIKSDGSDIGPDRFFPFVIAGECIDRKIYDVLNTYTGEIGSDGVIRVASANLQGRYIRLEQGLPVVDDGKLVAKKFNVASFKVAPDTPLRVVAGKSHSGKEMGIVRSVRAVAGEDDSSETVKAIFDCIKVTTKDDYEALYRQFIQETERVQSNELIEMERMLLGKPRVFIHDLFSMVIFRVRDSAGYPVNDYDLVLTGGDANDPNHLPEGFLKDKQRNRVNPEVLTYYFNHNIMHGMPAIRRVIDGEEKEIRGALPGVDKLGLRIEARPSSGFVHYLPCEIEATPQFLEQAIVANATTMIDIVLQRVVQREVFELVPPPGGDFKDIGRRLGTDIAR